ncbi:MAG TPA: MBL fold metallo-hydrolase [Longimicrobium sp.]|nr:MBL fold metallo-hydrolase [Longimicrobium sp.]
MLRTILAPNPSPMTLDGTRTYVVGRARAAVIDPGPDEPAHVQAVLEAVGDGSASIILLTHSHGDHAGAAAELARRTGAPIAMARGGLRETAGVDRRLEDGERIETDAGAIGVIATPGHAPEHVCFLWEQEDGGRALFAGDMFMGGADTTLVAPPEGSLSDYLTSLDRIERLQPTIIHPAHGPDITDPAAAIARYRAHRAERIAQVERALADAPAAPGELIGRVYGAELDPGLRGAAEGSLHAIIAHLLKSGRVRDAGGGRYALNDPDA